MNLKTTTHDQPEQIIQVYLAAIQTGDAEALKRIAAPNRSDIQLDIDQKLRSYSGLRLEHIKTTYEPTESPFFMSVLLQADGIKADGEKVRVEERLHLQKEQYNLIPVPFIQPRYSWFLLLGRSMATPVSDSPA